MKSVKFVFVFILVFVVFLSCTRKSEKETIVREMVSKKVNCFDVKSSDSVDYIVLSYIDKGGCVKCKLKLYKWKEFKEQLVALGKSVSIVFVANESVIKDLDLLLKEADFQPDRLICDKDNKFKTQNNIPKDFMLQTFLLDKTLKIVLVGNPIHNAKVKELYVKYMRK